MNSPAIAVFCLLLLSGVTLTAVTTTINPSEDTFIAGGSAATTVFGLANDLTVNFSGDDFLARKIYLSFDLTGLQQPFTDAALTLTVKGLPSSGTIQLNYYGLDDGAPGQGWSDSTLNWDNAPGNISELPGFDIEFFSLLGIKTISNPALNQKIALTNPESISTDALIQFLNADTDDQVTFGIYATSGSSISLTFNSIEKGTGIPELSLDETIIPEPGWSALLLAAGALILTFRKRGF